MAEGQVLNQVMGEGHTKDMQDSPVLCIHYSMRWLRCLTPSEKVKPGGETPCTAPEAGGKRELSNSSAQLFPATTIIT